MSGSRLIVPPGAALAGKARVPTGPISLGHRQLKWRGPYPDRETLELARSEMTAESFHLTYGNILEGGCWAGRDRLSVIASLERTPHGELLHLSLAYPDHDPPWSTIRDVRDAFFPDDVDVMMVLPRAEDYVNRHEHAFHLWETPSAWGLQ